MSDNNTEAKEKHRKEDKLIKSTLIILEDNKNKLNVSIAVVECIKYLNFHVLNNFQSWLKK